MGYEVFIKTVDEMGEPIGGTISLSDWEEAVNKTDGARISRGDWSVENPRTKEVISIKNSGADVEIYFPNQEKWIHAISWYNGTPSIQARGLDMDNIGDPATRVFFDLAAALKCRVFGENDEEYLRPGNLQ